MNEGRRADSKTKRFEGMSDLRPDPPKIDDEPIAIKVAAAIYDDVNIEDVFWTPDEREDLVNQIAGMIIRRKSVASIFYHLQRAQRPVDDRGNRPDHPWGCESLQTYPEQLIVAIARDVLDHALTEWEERYEVKREATDG